MLLYSPLGQESALEEIGEAIEFFSFPSVLSFVEDTVTFNREARALASVEVPRERQYDVEGGWS